MPSSPHQTSNKGSLPAGSTICLRLYILKKLERELERVPLLRSIPLFQFLRIMIRPHLYRQIGKYSGILNFRTFDYIHIALQNYNFFLQGLLFPPFLPGALNSHGTPTWHFPQPYLGEYFTFISSSLALQRILFLPCSKEIA